MGITSSLPGMPGMKSGHTSRNIVLGGAYVSLLSISVLGVAPLAVMYRSWDGC